jgi:hypothetical protein
VKLEIGLGRRGRDEVRGDVVDCLRSSRSRLLRADHQGISVGLHVALRKLLACKSCLMGFALASQELLVGRYLVPMISKACLVEARHLQRARWH